MNSSISIPVGVVLSREKINHPWQDHAWRVIGVFLNAPEISEWRELRRDETSVHYHAATLPLELHRKEAWAYRDNLQTGEPAVYVVLRHDPGAESPWPVSVPCITASPYDAQAYLESGLETVHQVPMPPELVTLVEEFVAVHHVDEPFAKRQRQRHYREEEHQFGQEPIFELRERMRGRPAQGDGHDG